MLAKTVGVRQLIVAVTKMDDPTVQWAQPRFDEIVERLTPFLKQVGFAGTDIHWLPISGLQGLNISDRIPDGMCPWYNGPSLLEMLDTMKPPERLFDKPLRLPVAAKYKERGVIVVGKLESGTIEKGDKLTLMPNKNPVTVEKLYLDDTPIAHAEPGDNVRLKLLGGISEDDISPGFVLCRPDNLVPVVTKFKARVIILEHKSILCAGYSAVMHLHAAVKEVVFEELEALVDKRGTKVLQARPKFVKSNQAVLAVLTLDSPVCMQTYKDYQQLGRFMLRDEGKTVGIGVVTELVTCLPV